MRRGKADAPPGILATARVDVKTKALVKRLAPGEIAVIDHPDLDRVSADELIACKVAAVVNAAKSTTGRYPNLGPQMLIEAGIPLVDDVGHDVLTRVQEGALVRLDADTLYTEVPAGSAAAKGADDAGNAQDGRAAVPSGLAASPEVVAKGTLQTAESVAAALAEAEAGVVAQIDCCISRGSSISLSPRSTPSPPTRWSSCAVSGTCSPTASRSPACARPCAKSTSSSWSAATATGRTCGRCGPTSASTAR